MIDDPNKALLLGMMAGSLSIRGILGGGEVSLVVDEQGDYADYINVKMNDKKYKLTVINEDD